MVAVALTWRQVREAAHAGCDRRIRGLAGKKRDRFDGDGNVWDRDVVGMIGERALHVLAGIPWGPDHGPDHDTGDVAGLEVRTVQQNWHRLPLHDYDYDDRPHVLVIVRTRLLPVVEVAGWIMGRDGKRTRYWNRNVQHPCYMVPTQDLHDWPAPWPD